MIITKKGKPIVTIVIEEQPPIYVADLEYDLRNLRLAHMGKLNEENIEAILSSTREFHVNYLVNDIKERGLQEPLILYPHGNMVIEGNRRLCALKILAKISEISKIIETVNNENDSEIIQDFFKKYPYLEQFENLIEPDNPLLQQFQNMKVSCNRIARGTSPEAIDAYLTSIHIAHKEKWKKFNRAKMLYKLRNEGLHLADIAKIAEVSRSTATREIETFKLHREYRRAHPEDIDWVGKFYYFWELLATKGTKFRQNKNNIHNFMSVLASDAFGGTKQVRELLDAVSETEQTSFTQDEIRSLKSSADKYKPDFKSADYTKVGQTTKILDYFSNKELELAATDPKRKNLLEKLYKSCEKVLEKIDRRQS